MCKSTPLQDSPAVQQVPCLDEQFLNILSRSSTFMNSSSTCNYLCTCCQNSSNFAHCNYLLFSKSRKIAPKTPALNCCCIHYFCCHQQSQISHVAIAMTSGSRLHGEAIDRGHRPDIIFTHSRPYGSTTPPIQLRLPTPECWAAQPPCGVEHRGGQRGVPYRGGSAGCRERCLWPTTTSVKHL